MNHLFRPIAIFLLAPWAVLHAAKVPAAEGTWRSYEVYEPAIERYFVCAGELNELIA
jgi:hypothetical protein